MIQTLCVECGKYLDQKFGGDGVIHTYCNACKNGLDRITRIKSLIKNLAMTHPESEFFNRALIDLCETQQHEINRLREEVARAQREIYTANACIGRMIAF